MKKKLTIPGVISIIIALFFFICGFLMENAEFGGDFYTYTYQGLLYIYRVLTFGFSGLFLVIGIICLAVSTYPKK